MRPVPGKRSAAELRATLAGHVKSRARGHGAATARVLRELAAESALAKETSSAVRKRRADALSDDAKQHAADLDTVRGVRTRSAAPPAVAR